MVTHPILSTRVIRDARTKRLAVCCDISVASLTTFVQSTRLPAQVAVGSRSPFTPTNRTTPRFCTRPSPLPAWCVNTVTLLSQRAVYCTICTWQRVRVRAIRSLTDCKPGLENPDVSSHGRLGPWLREEGGGLAHVLSPC